VIFKFLFIRIIVLLQVFWAPEKELEKCNIFEDISGSV
jgi:hypothetical protein